MILIDGNNLTRRMLHVAVAETLKDVMKDFDGSTPPTTLQIQEFRRVFLHMVLWEILEMKAKYQRNYGNVLIAFDSKNPWRKRVFAGYKAKRHDKSNATPAEKLEDKLFYWAMEALDQILEATNFKVINHLITPDEYGIEADDIIGVLAPLEKSVICSNDEDFTQLLNDNVRQYHPQRKALLENPTKKDVEMWKQFNIISGQAKDGIPGIMQHCKLSPEFIEWVNKTHNLEINGEMIEKIETDHRALMDEYEALMFVEDSKSLLEGTRKKRRYLTAYEKPRGGEKMVLEFLKNFDINMKINARWKEHYERNSVLLLFDRIPQDVRDVIVGEMKKPDERLFFDTIPLQNLLLQFSLYNIEKRMSDF